ncbi:hypothetical protein ACSBR1_006816 [Camellia fascicularis]
MATTIATTMAMLNPNFTTTTNPPKLPPPTTKPTSLLSMLTLPKALTTSKPPPHNPNLSTALAGAVFSTLSSCNPAMAAQQIAEIAEGDNRGLALLLPIIPAIAWVLFNILQPALNQINKMSSSKGVIIGLGLSGGLLGMSMTMTPHASASEVAMVAEAAASDNRGQLLLFVIAPAILWVLYNILQPALNQLNRMRS